LKWFLFEKRTPSQNSSGIRCSGCFQAKTAKMLFTDFFLDFWANVSEFFKKDFLLISWSKKTIFGFEKLRRIASLFLENLMLQLTNPLFLEND